jgi:WD40 repeat protein
MRRGWPEEPLWLVAPHMPGWLEQKRRPVRFAPGCYWVEPDEQADGMRTSAPTRRARHARLHGQRWLGPDTFSPDGTRVVTASYDNTVRVWDAATGRPVMILLEHQDKVLSAIFSPDGTRVVTASVDKTARV